MIYTDDYGEIVNTRQKYKCVECGWVGTVKEMEGTFDGDYGGDEVYTDYGCPECWHFYPLLSSWEIE